ncbi:phage tail assembly protein [Paraburkholderia bonniea]|uniref:phage tail assembly protein n=1 Tax=Paraburkholderia bonniea TaxID=2152891 RepID=UPI001290F7F7|nr:phage tail assembly protein [Paraburkholderia bonniea]
MSKDKNQERIVIDSGPDGHAFSVIDTGNPGDGDIDEAKDPNTCTLDTPLKRGEQVITKVTLRKPDAGELRGTSLSDLVSLDVAALQKVLPRVSTPTLTEIDVARMDPADLVQLGGIFVGFLMPKAAKSKLEYQTG